MDDTKPAVTVVTAPEDLDVYTSRAIRLKLRETVDQGARVVVADLGSTTFIDSTGLAVLVGGLRYARDHSCAFGIACSRELTLKAFRISGLAKVFDIRDSVEEFTGSAAKAREDGAS